MQNFIKISLILCFAFLQNSIQAQEFFNMTKVGHLPLYNRGENNGANGGLVANDVTGFVKNGVEYAIVGMYKGTSIVSLANPAAPVELFFIPAGNTTGNDWRDLEIWGNYAYVTQEQEGSGVLIINLANLPAAETHQWWKPNVTVAGNTQQLTSTHSLNIKDGFMYLNGSNIAQKGVLIYDVNTTPGTPIFKAAVDDAYTHDSFVRGDTLFDANIYEGKFRTYNVANKSAPVAIGIPQATPFLFTHNCWTSDNGRYIFTTDEKANAPVAAYDIADLNNIQQVGLWNNFNSLNAGAIAHNVYGKPGNFMVTAHYTDGAVILDVQRPDNIIKVAAYDTHPTPITTTPFEGVWACYPYLPSGLMLASDINEGLWVFQPSYVRASWLEGVVRDCNNNVLTGVDVTIKSAGVAINNTTSVGSGVYKTGYGIPGTYQVTYTKTGYPTVVQNVTLASGVVTNLDVVLANGSSVTLNGNVQSLGGATNLLGATVIISNASGSLTATTDANGNFTIPCFAAGTYDVYVGKWGYKEKALLQQNLSSAALNVQLIKGYEDSYFFDLGWTVGGNCVAGKGVWQRGEPDNVLTQQGQQFTPALDNQSDLGTKCYLTGAGGGQIGADDLDNCYTILTSPTMDLTVYANPTANFDYWFTNLITSGAAPDDKFWAVMSNGTRQDTIFSTTVSQFAWHTQQSVRIKDFQPLTANMRLSFIACDRGNSNWSEAAVDYFNVGEYVGTNTVQALNVGVAIFPNPTNSAAQLRLTGKNDLNTRYTVHVYNVLGQEMESQQTTGTAEVLTIGSRLEAGSYYVRVEANGEWSDSSMFFKN